MTDLAIKQGNLSGAWDRLWAPADERPRGFGTWVVLNLLVCAAYSVAGLVVLLFGIGPAKISPIYPPAGIAIAATFILRDITRRGNEA